MATAPHIPIPARTLLPFPLPRQHKNPLAKGLVLWHLLSLDAPTVAAVWTWFLAAANHIRLPWTSTAAMAIAVWLLYAADRLLDARLLDARLLDARLQTATTLEARHRFHHRHRVAFRIGIALASIFLAALLPRLPLEAIRLYLIEGSFLIGYFLLIHTTRAAHRVPKELAVGLFFAAATFIPTISPAPSLRPPLLAPALLFAALCGLNCLFIYAWEHPKPDSATHPITAAALRHLHPIAYAILLITCALGTQAPRAIPLAIAASTALLFTLHHSRRAFAPTTLRAAADVTLLTPLLFLLTPLFTALL